MAEFWEVKEVPLEFDMDLTMTELVNRWLDSNPNWNPISFSRVIDGYFLIVKRKREI